jgi:hypothetical protein
MNVYLEAAKLLVRKPTVEYSCNAIGTVLWLNGKPTESAVRDYAALFSPNQPLDADEAWLTNTGHSKRALAPGQEAAEWRLTALCFAAAMHDTGDL